ncbi:MAG: STAS domain-containing protein [Spirochaetes bacterium]|nr:STAS domain-containing protein [Spirochaetota bacterium]
MKVVAKRKVNGSGTVLYRFEGDLTVYTVKKLVPALIKDLRAHAALELDLSGVHKFDSAGYQLMLLMDRDARQDGKGFSISGKSDEVSRILSLYGSEL